jgi:hypothetical protein
MTAPEWLTRHAGDLIPVPNGHALAVVLNGSQQYRLEPMPVGLKFGCRIIQTVNGRRLDGPTTWETKEQALQGGLEELRKLLGW